MRKILICNIKLESFWQTKPLISLSQLSKISLSSVVHGKVLTTLFTQLASGDRVVNGTPVIGLNAMQSDSCVATPVVQLN